MIEMVQPEDMEQREVAREGLKRTLKDVLLEIRLLRHGSLERMYFKHDHWRSLWKGAYCQHDRGHGTYAAAEECLRKRARRDAR